MPVCLQDLVHRGRSIHRGQESYNQSDQKVCTRGYKRGLSHQGNSLPLWQPHGSSPPTMTIVPGHLMLLLTSTDSFIHMVHLYNTKVCVSEPMYVYTHNQSKKRISVQFILAVGTADLGTILF